MAQFLMTMLRILILARWTTESHAERYLCMPERQKVLLCRRKNCGVDFLVPEKNKDQGNDFPNLVQDYCKWELGLHKERVTMQVSLEAIPRSLLLKDEPQKQSIPDGLSKSIPAAQVNWTARPMGPAPESNYLYANLTDGTFTVASLHSNGDPMIVTMQAYERAKIVLRVAAINPGYCASHMTSYRNHCFHLLTKNMTVNDVLNVINQTSTGGMQLASFDSLDDIRKFLDSNKVQEDVYPIKTPLDLTHPVRIGLFYYDGMIMTTKTRNCSVELAKHSSEIMSISKVSGGRCGSLIVNQSNGLPVIEFVDCRLEMPNLISFPEFPLKHCVNCAQHIREWLASTGSPNEYHENFLVKRFSRIHIIVIASVITVLMLILVSITLLFRLRKLRSNCTSQATFSGKQRIENHKSSSLFNEQFARPDKGDGSHNCSNPEVRLCDFPEFPSLLI